MGNSAAKEEEMEKDTGGDNVTELSVYREGQEHIPRALAPLRPRGEGSGAAMATAPGLGPSRAQSS